MKTKQQPATAPRDDGFEEDNERHLQQEQASEADRSRSGARNLKLASRYASLCEGVQYILHHPLLPGLYSLDWGMTVRAARTDGHCTVCQCGHTGQPWAADSCHVALLMQVVSFYRELFPMFVAQLFTSGRG